MNESTSITRRELLGASLGLAASAAFASSPSFTLGADRDDKRIDRDKSLENQVGITTSSLAGHLTAKPGQGQFSLEQLPEILRDELGMRVIDLNTSSLASLDERYLDRCRNAAEKAGSRFINLKLNQRNLDMNSADEATRNHALAEYQRSINAASMLGCRWARVLPTAEKPDQARHVSAQRQLADYCAARNMQLLIENYGWMATDAASVPTLIAAIDRNVAACPDTGNWANNEVRAAGLKATFPLAVTCDFKARELGPQGEHAAYDLKSCFTIGWQAGFRGPWCLEHANRDRSALFKELALLSDMLKTWTQAAQH